MEQPKRTVKSLKKKEVLFKHKSAIIEENKSRTKWAKVHIILINKDLQPELGSGLQGRWRLRPTLPGSSGGQSTGGNWESAWGGRGPAD